MNLARITPLRIGPYLLTERIGSGGMAAVYKARRRGASGFETSVVVKTLLPEHRRNARIVRMFKDEARLTAQLQHENIVRVHDFGLLGDTHYLEMEYLPGWSLLQLWKAVVARGERLPVAIALALVTDACRGLAYAHAFVDDKGAHRPIIHRDISPANVMIGRDGSVKLVDFGMAQLTHGETLVIETFVGKIAYMSPEQIDRRQVDRRADVFALGVTLWELLTGERLFGGGNDIETLGRLQRLVIDPPSARNPEVPAALDVITLRALARDPDARYASAVPMLSVLESLADVAASRTQVMRYLGGLAPEVFSRTCEDCGGSVAWGAECASCITRVEAPSSVSAPIAIAAARDSLSAARQAQRPNTGSFVRRRWLLMQLTLLILWRRFDGWLALQRSRSLDRTARRHADRL